MKVTHERARLAKIEAEIRASSRIVHTPTAVVPGDTEDLSVRYGEESMDLRIFITPPQLPPTWLRGSLPAFPS